MSVRQVMPKQGAQRRKIFRRWHGFLQQAQKELAVSTVSKDLCRLSCGSKLDFIKLIREEISRSCKED